MGLTVAISDKDGMITWRMIDKKNYEVKKVRSKESTTKVLAEVQFWFFAVTQLILFHFLLHLSSED